MIRSCLFAGRATVDVVYQLGGFPAEDAKMMATDFLIQAGGPALNAAVTFSFLGGKGTLISAWGQSPLSQVIADELERHAVTSLNCHASVTMNPPLSSIVLNSQNGTRTIFNSPNADFDDGWVSHDPPAADMLLLDGFYVPQLQGTIDRFTAENRPVCLDGGSWKNTTQNLLSSVSIAICSERFLPPGIDAPADVINYLHDKGIKHVAITRGSREISGSDDGRSFSIPVTPGNAVDTLGAGDILHGAFCWYYLTGSSFEEALRQASVIASRSCQFFGARQWMSDFHQRTT